MVQSYHQKHLRFYAINIDAIRDVTRVPGEKGDEI